MRKLHQYSASPVIDRSRSELRHDVELLQLNSLLQIPISSQIDGFKEVASGTPNPRRKRE
jgi:hypothetical protein